MADYGGLLIDRGYISYRDGLEVQQGQRIKQGTPDFDGKTG